MKTIHNEPSKEFFVDMITRDISLERAILDLIDNSVDAGKSFFNSDLTQASINLTIQDNKFTIEDNCGGISKDIALKNAFKFGKEKDFKFQDNSIGRFGIGLKRALFKIGNQIDITSIHLESDFTMSLNVKIWKETDDWDFDLNIKEEKHIKSECKTIIEITDIHENINSEFRKTSFIENLKSSISKAHSLIIKDGLRILINNIPIHRTEFKLKNGPNLKPEILKFNYPSNENPQVRVKIIAGVDFGTMDRDKHKGGWYIFCNDRLILDADQSDITGWDTEMNEMKIVKFHPDYAYFRGYVLINSNDAALLPWTTTKTGLDSDSDVYKAIYFEMRKVLYKILAFLKERRDEERDYKKDLLDSNPRTKLIEIETKSIDFLELKDIEDDFIAIVNEPQRQLPKGGTITYWRSSEDLDLLKEYFGVTTNKEVGEITFDYFIKMLKS